MPTPISDPEVFPPVPEDEMAFALSYFIGAADQKFTIDQRDDEQSSHLDQSCRRLFAQLYGTLSDPGSPLKTSAKNHRRQTEATLLGTFKAVCIHYHDSENLASICARVLGFYLLMEESAGKVVAEWTEEDPKDERYITLSRPVIQALASVPLGASARISRPTFIAVIQEITSCASNGAW